MSSAKIGKFVPSIKTVLLFMYFVKVLTFIFFYKTHALLEQTSSLLFQYHVPKKFWWEALLIATYLINRLLPKS